MKVLNFGSLNYDYVYKVDHVITPGETMDSISLEMHFGGKGLNPSPYNEALLACDLHKISVFLLNEIEGLQSSGERKPEKILD